MPEGPRPAEEVGGDVTTHPSAGEVVPPPPPPREEERKKRDLKAEALSTEHLLTHKPFNPYCEGCKVGKMRERNNTSKGHSRGKSRSGATLSQLIT